MKCPGGTHGERSSGAVSCGVAAIGNCGRGVGTGVRWRSHVKRCIPAAVESTCGGRIQYHGMFPSSFGGSALSRLE